MVAGDRGHVGGRVELDTGVGHYLADRHRWRPLLAIMVAVPTSNTCRMCRAFPARKAATRRRHGFVVSSPEGRNNL